jgi:rsbT co-antagonist protein RsbR
MALESDSAPLSREVIVMAKEEVRKSGEFGVLSLIQTPISVIDRDMTIRFVNDSVLGLLNRELDDVVGKKCYELFESEDCHTDQCRCKQAMESGSTAVGETVSHGLGDMDIKYFGTPFRDENGEIAGCVETIFDITEIKRAGEELRRAQEKVIQAAREIMELSNPIVTVFDDVLVLPVIGTLDSERTQRIMENLLQTIVDTQSSVVIVDITGVPVVDTLTATHLLKTASAVRLLGATSIVTGISPNIAQTLVTLGVDLSELITKARMVDGIETALEMLNRKIVSIE